MESARETIQAEIENIKHKLAEMDWEYPMLMRQAKPLNDRLAEIEEDRRILNQRLSKISSILG